MGKSGHQDNLKPVFFFFFDEKIPHKRGQKAQKAPNVNKRFPSPKSYCTRKKTAAFALFA